MRRLRRRRARSRAKRKRQGRLAGLRRRRLVENSVERREDLFWELNVGAVGHERFADRAPFDVLPLERLPEPRELFIRRFHGLFRGWFLFGLPRRGLRVAGKNEWSGGLREAGAWGGGTSSE